MVLRSVHPIIKLKFQTIAVDPATGEKRLEKVKQTINENDKMVSVDGLLKLDSNLLQDDILENNFKYFNISFEIKLIIKFYICLSEHLSFKGHYIFQCLIELIVLLKAFSEKGHCIVMTMIILHVIEHLNEIVSNMDENIQAKIILSFRTTIPAIETC